MKRGVVYIVCFLLMICGIAAAQEPGTTRKFLNGVEHYQKKEYQRSIALFKEIADSGITNGALYYNLGNAYFKTGDIGNAILWYERAKKYLPRDPDLEFNLNYVRSLVRDERVPDSPLYSVLFFWNALLSRQTVIWGAIVCNLVFWLLFAVQRIRPFKSLRIAAVVCAMLSVVFAPTAFYNYYEAAYQKQGVVLPEKIDVRSGLSDQATSLFALHAGSRIKIQEEKGEFYRIFFSNGKIGWVRKSVIGVI